MAGFRAVDRTRVDCGRHGRSAIVIGEKYYVYRRAAGLFGESWGGAGERSEKQREQADEGGRVVHLDSR